MSTDTPSLYSVRRLNPFEGVEQIIDAGQLRATSTDGDLWELRVKVSIGDVWGSLEDPLESYDFRLFAFWKRSDGQLRHVTHPAMNQRLIEHAEKALMQIIEDAISSLPFPLVDQYELWAVDTNQMPIALLSSCCHTAQLYANEMHRWQACRLTDYDFQPDSIEPETMNPRDAANRLEHLVNRAIVRRLWFRREPDGSGTAFSDQSGRQYNPDDFPPALLQRHWDDEETNQLVQEWIRWKSAALLTLSRLDSGQRKELEEAAWDHAFHVHRHHRLYPEVLDRELLKATLVKAKLIVSNAMAS
jgi:hypothetical protein